MKIAITATEKSLTSPVEARFGRAPYFLIYDLETDLYEFLENTQSLDAASGAGLQAAQNVIQSGAKAVITGHCGPKAFKALTAAEIKIFVGINTTIIQAIEDFATGRLVHSDKPDVEGHWE